MTGTWRWWLVAIAGVGLVATAASLLLYWSELPEPMAVHWSLDFRPDGSMPKRTALLTPLALIAGALLVALIGSARVYAAGRAMRVWLVTFASVLATILSTLIVQRNLGREIWTDAGSLSPGMVVLPMVFAIAVATAAGLVALRAWRGVQPPAPPGTRPLPLAAGARGYWTGTASNPWLLVTGVVLLVPVAALFAAQPQVPVLQALLAVFVIAAVVLEHFSHIRVTIDGRGVRIRFGHLGLWTKRIPLARIVAVQAVDVDPLAHSGWGYRGSLLLLRKASIVVRAGSGLKLDLTRGQRLFVTVDDAATAAQLLSALLSRRPAGTSTAAATTT